MMNFDPFWKMMQNENITQYQLVRYYRLSPSLIYRLRHNLTVTTDSLARICELFDCKVSDIMYFSKHPVQ